MYIPRGPIIRNWEDILLRTKVLSDLYEIGKQRNVIFIKMDPEVELGRGVPGEAVADENSWAQNLIGDLREDGWIPSPEQVQFRNTMTIDLQPELEQLLANMKQKTRYNVRLAERRGVTVRPGNLEE